MARRITTTESAAALDAAALAERAEQARELREDAAEDARRLATQSHHTPEDEPSSAAAAPTTRTCGCGCGITGKGRFRPGHDARLHGRVARRRAGRMADAEWSALLATEREAIEDFCGDPAGSFAQVGTKPAGRSAAEWAIDRATAKVARLTAELAAAQAELDGLLPAPAPVEEAPAE